MFKRFNWSKTLQKYCSHRLLMLEFFLIFQNGENVISKVEFPEIGQFHNDLLSPKIESLNSESQFQTPIFQREGQHP